MASAAVRPLRLFVSVGTQLPFDRLIKALDQIAGENRDYQVFAQIGDSTYLPKNFEFKKFIDLDEYHRRIQECHILVAHAGMGAILSALEVGKPIVIMPRLASLREHRNDHQLATAQRFSEMGKVVVASSENELSECLSRVEATPPESLIGKHASPNLIETVRSFILDE